jgi:signal transduction histidine kinase
MPDSELGGTLFGPRARLALPIAVILGLLLFVLTYLGIQKSRSDSLELIRQQGTALIESMTLSAENAIKANSLFDLLVQEKFSDLVGFLDSRRDLRYSSAEMADFSSEFGIDAIFIFDTSSAPVAAGARGLFINLEEIRELLIPLIDSLLNDSVSGSRFQTIESGTPGNASLLFLQKSADEKFVFAFVSDALFYSSAKRDIGIGYLVQNIAREVGIEYILFQTEQGIIFSSRKIGPMLKIEKDPFLASALESDTVLSREYLYNEMRVLELVKPFSSVEYPRGLFRLGISLEKYYSIMAGFDRQMIALSAVIFAVLVLAMLYLSGKQKRIKLDRSFKRVKSLSEKVFDSINAGLVTIGKDGTIEMANRQFLNIFAARETEIVGQLWQNMAFRTVIPFDRILLGHHGPGEVESTLELPSGKKHLLINIARLYDYENKEAGAVAVVYDYTGIKELEETARRKERLTELGDLAAGVAHEIRNPLNAISIAAQRLMAEFEPKENPEDFQSFTRQIKSEANRLNEIVSRFLAMARGQSSARNQFDAGHVAEEAVRFLGLGIETDRVKLESRIESGLSIRGNEDRLKQLVINLVRNSLEACGEKGGNVLVRLFRDHEQVVLLVKDTGPGIPEEIRKKIFSPYFTTKDKGTGLGLSIVHQIVEEFQGKMELLTPPGGGAEFRIIFPAA